MTIERYAPTDIMLPPPLRELLEQLYGQQAMFDFFVSEYGRAFQYCIESTRISFLPIAIKSEGALVGHVALILDDRLPAGEAFFGFFEVVNDEEVYKALWNALLSSASSYQVRVLKGPVNGSVWHQYRCVKTSNGQPFFKTEPQMPLYYYEFLSGKNPLIEISYSSGLRRSISGVMETLQAQLQNVEQQLTQSGFTITVEHHVRPEVLSALAQLSRACFADKSWGYTELTPAEFAALYDLQKLNEHLDHLFLLYYQNDIVGYCSTMKEGTTLIIKTICVLPSFQGQGLGNALALRVHEVAENEQCDAVVYALVRDGNQVHNFSTDDIEVFRTYAAFEFDPIV